jgi:hypothetical protein
MLPLSSVFNLLTFPGCECAKSACVSGNKSSPTIWLIVVDDSTSILNVFPAQQDETIPWQSSDRISRREDQLLYLIDPQRFSYLW